MSSVDISKLIDLAVPAYENDLKSLGILADSVVADELRAEIEAQAAEQRKGAVKAAATNILELGRKKEEADKRNVESIRSLRGEIKRIKKQLLLRQAAWDQGSATLNYLPLAAMVECDVNVKLYHRGINTDLTKIDQKYIDAVTAKATDADAKDPV